LGVSAPWRQGFSKATRHYRSLFILPPRPVIALLRFAVGSLFGLSLSLRPEGLLLGIAWMTLPSLASDLLTFRLAEGESLLRLRRIMALSLFADFLWLCSVSAGGLAVILGMGDTAILVAYAIGFSAAASSRLLVLRSLSPMALPRAVALALIHPSLCLAVTSLSYPLPAQTLAYVGVSLPFTMASVYALLSRVDSVARRALGYGSLELFRAFAANWMEDRGEPLERIFDRIAVLGEARLGLVSLRDPEAEFATLVIPYVHAGPFKNVGSSLLARLVEERLRWSAGQPVAVFHGTVGHEKNMATRAETMRAIDALVSAPAVHLDDLKASFMLRLTQGRAKVTCQRLNNVALVAATLAPSNMEDLPEEVGSTIAAYGKALGFDAVFVIDAHNSIGGSEAALSDEDIKAVVAASKTALEAVMKQTLLPATVGACNLRPREFTVEQGMGRGGLTTVVITVPGQTAAYLVMDGNNMISGLRERVLTQLSELGVDIGEVFTSDTHEVNATITGRGYHPLGEAIDNDALIELAYTSVREALANRGAVEMAWKEVRVEGVRFLGSKNVDLLTAATDAAIVEAKRAALVLFPLALVTTLAVLSALPV